MRNEMTRRNFIGRTMASLPLAAMAARAEEKKDEPAAKPPAYERKIKIGLIGCGSRGNWISEYFKKHGGFTIHACTDYFEKAADEYGETMGVDKSRRFSGLSGYKKVIASGVEAVVVLDVPYFYPEQVKAAIDAGLHVYMAKPVAVDVPGTVQIGESGKRATQKKLVLLVDYQLPTDPAIIEIAQRIRDGDMGRFAHILSLGFAWHSWPDPEIGKTIESRLRDQIWLSDTGLSGDTIVSYDIHLIDTLVYLLGKRPVSACGHSRTIRPKVNGDRTDTASVIYQLDDGTTWTHVTQSLDNEWDITTLSGKIFGTTGTTHVQYGGKVYLKAGAKTYVDKVGNVFDEGVERNIATFYRNITEGHFENGTVQRAVDGHLTAILGREAAARRSYMTMDELIKENKRLTVDLSGLKA